LPELCVPASENNHSSPTLPPIASSRLGTGASEAMQLSSTTASLSSSSNLLRSPRSARHGREAVSDEEDGAEAEEDEEASTAEDSASARQRKDSSNRAMDRSDPALKDAFEHLERARSKQPTMQDFGLERFLGRAPRRSGSQMSSGSRAFLSVQENYADENATDLEAAVDAYLAQTAAPEVIFSTDQLLAAVRTSSSSSPIPPEASRSTSPGSTTQLSTFSSGESSVSDRIVRPTPPAAPPQSMEVARRAPRPGARRGLGYGGIASNNGSSTGTGYANTYGQSSRPPPRGR